MAFDRTDTTYLKYRQEEASLQLRSFVEGNLISQSTEVDRIVMYQLMWHFYNGRHWKNYNDTFLSFNYFRVFIDKINTFLIGDKPFSHEVTSFMNDEVEEGIEKVAEGIIDFTWRKSNLLTLAYEALQMGAVTGDLWIYPEWDDDRQFIQIKVLDSRHCFPRFHNGDYKDVRAFMVRMPLAKNDNNYKVYVMEFKKDIITSWYQKDTTVDGKRIDEREKVNPFGFIPIVHIKNKPMSMGYYSRSDSSDIMKINKVYNELGQQIKNIIDYYGTPTTVITGGTVKGLQKGLGKIWSGLPPEANVFNLGLGEDLSSSIAFMDKLKMSMHELSDVPESSLGRLQAISNTSAAALQVTYQPLIQQANQKAMMYGEGFAEVNRMIIKMLRVITPNDKNLRKLPDDFEENHSITPVFTYGLPQDRMVELQQANMELTMKIASRDEVMNRLGKSNVPQLIKEIDEDLVHMQQMLNPVGPDGQPIKVINPTNQAGNSQPINPKTEA